MSSWALSSSTESTTQLSLGSPLHLASNNLAPPTSWPELSARQTGFSLTGLCCTSLSLSLATIRKKKKKKWGFFSRYFGRDKYSLVVVAGVAAQLQPTNQLVENVDFSKPYFLIDFAVWNLNGLGRNITDGFLMFFPFFGGPFLSFNGGDKIILASGG